MAKPSRPRPVRDLAIADHLWNSFERMAREMGTDREGLVDQAMQMFAQFNGFVVPRPAAAAAFVPPPAPMPAPQPTEDAARRAVAKHVMDTAAEFEKLLKGKKK